jgi:hypothetical protein
LAAPTLAPATRSPQSAVERGLEFAAYFPATVWTNAAATASG